MPTPPNKIRPPVVDDYDDKNQRQVRTAILQVSGALSGGKLIGRKLLTGSGVYSPTTGVTAIHVQAIGAGGGGGGVAAVGSTSVGGGGASGTAIDIFLGASAPIAGGPYSCGTGGAGGTTAGSNGSSGGDTTIVLNGTTYVAKGGGGGGGGTANIGGFWLQVGGSPTAGSTSGLGSANPGEYGEVINNTFWSSGSGGAVDMFGIGGIYVTGTGPGNPGTGFGAGGSGGAAQNANQPGGRGSDGAIVIYEFA
jgi:hypothetical protein